MKIIYTYSYIIPLLVTHSLYETKIQNKHTKISFAPYHSYMLNYDIIIEEFVSAIKTLHGLVTI